ncbi:ribosome maturation factor RimP [Lachnospiraceae bacterium KH1T2]|nr:ribosome maturation factor RimP [Lachnospiraceae bacterium KH1T2]
MDNIAIANKFADLIKPVVDEYGFELIRTEYVKENGNYYLRAYIDKPEGITIDDCVLVSRRASKLLDREDYIEDAYTMEISSPGFMEEPDVKGDTE